MYRVRVSSRFKSQLRSFRNVKRELALDGQWRFYALLGWFQSVEEAEAARARQRGLVAANVSLEVTKA